MAKFTYVVVLENPNTGATKGKIGRTNNLVERMRALEYENKMSINARRSVFYEGDLESQLLVATKRWSTGSERSEYRSTEGVKRARAIAKADGHKSIRFDSFFKLLRAEKEQNLQELFLQKEKEFQKKERLFLLWQAERNVVLEAQLQWRPHPKRKYKTFYGWKKLGTKKIALINNYDSSLVKRLERLRSIACRLLQSIVTPDIAHYLKACQVDDSDLGYQYQIVYGWMPFDRGRNWGDLEATVALVRHSNAWREERPLHRFEETTLSVDFKHLTRAPISIRARLASISRECQVAQNRLCAVWDLIESTSKRERLIL